MSPHLFLEFSDSEADCTRSHVDCAAVAIVNGDTADDVYARVTEVIRDHSELVVWVPLYDNP